MITPEFDGESLGLYIHIPFCRSKCLYCDFYSLPRADGGLVEKYIDRLCEVIEKYAKDCRSKTVDTVYLGGGTPTYLQADKIVKIIDTVKNNYLLSPDAEISIECNPATADEDKLKIIRNCGINRLSIGFQSAHENELKALGRIHGKEDFENIFADARRAGFDNISVDLMFGIPEQSAESFGKTLEYVCSLSPEHISAYDLKIEDSTPFGKMKDSLPLPGEDAESEMYFSMTDFLEKQGYHQYEISNFAKDGRYSRHNMRYWKRADYLGFGPGAHSFFGGRRFSFPSDINLFVSGIFEDKDAYSVDGSDAENEFIMLRARLCEGISIPLFDRIFGHGESYFAEKYGKKLEKYIAPGLVEYDAKDQRYILTKKGFWLSNTILSDVLEF